MGLFKVFLRSFCLTGASDQPSEEPPFDMNIDVSHLAEPHITAPPSQIYDRASPVTQNDEIDNEESFLGRSAQQRATPNNCATSAQQHPPSQRNSILTTNNDEGAPFAQPSSSLHVDSGSSQPSSPPYAPSPSNVYESQNNSPAAPTPESHQHPSQGPNHRPPPVAPRDVPSPGPGLGPSATKLSYDIISVREPLAKILAERQQLLQSQQQQRQLLGEHDYIEVYGERGSSCFYEEIAGSVTSSATYDQIGSNSNHNYQVLVNAYSVANRQSTSNQDNEIARPEEGTRSDVDGSSADRVENAYDVTSHPPDQIDGPSTSARQDNTASNISAAPNLPNSTSNARHGLIEGEISQLTQSIPVYSVINKATRRNNSIMRSSLDDSRPPKPPPKNLLIAQHQQQHSPGGMNPIDGPSTSPRAWSPSHQLPSTSSYADRVASSNEFDTEDMFKMGKSTTHRNVRLPQPPPRLSKHSVLNHATDRPLPSPNSNNINNNNNNNNNGKMSDRNATLEDDDIDSVNNGYELLKSNMGDDQIDVGYEKIKEPNRYSGGSISSQFYQRQLIDNGGYESVQPIYSSPSNALVEPNYEVIAPATASELAANATAKLNAAASVIEQFLKKDQ